MKRAVGRKGPPVRHPAPKRRRAVVIAKADNVQDLEDLGVDIPAARAELLDWYVRSHRVLPWRQSPGSSLPQHSPDSDSFAYSVWVSEVMLQQTQVVTVVDYFERWMHKWPTVDALAQATLEDVREMWSGLGYYSRATNLHRGAQFLVENFDGHFPKTIQQLQTIPGVGPYTSRAIASIAFGVAEAVVDGNVIRVLSRLFTIQGDPQKQRKHFQRMADDILDSDRPGDFNQAMMELGAVICRPTNPQCQTCPIQSHCKAYRQTQNDKTDDETSPKVTDYPMLPKKSPKKKQHVAVCIFQTVSTTEAGDAESWYLLLRRPKTGLLAGLWEFPTVSLEPSETQEVTTRRSKFDAFLRSVSDIDLSAARVIERASLDKVVHIFTHIHMTLHIETVTVEAEIHDVSFAEEVEHKWVSRGGLQSMGLCGMVKKVRDVYNENKQSTPLRGPMLSS